MNITPITLGTAQLTMPYGIANSNNNISKESAFSLLENALENGINTWDTSPPYGKSEEIIGDYLNKSVTWNGNSDIGLSTDQSVRFRFKMLSADLYDIRFF